MTTVQYANRWQPFSPEKHFHGKQCGKCGQTQRYKSTSGCVTCGRERCRKHYQANTERRKETGAEYRKNNPGSWRRAHLKRAYRMTLEEFNKLFQRQGNRCAICYSETHGGRGWHVDHCHASGKIRGILCHPCNSTLGYAKEDVARLKACASYLRKHSGVKFPRQRS